MFIRGKTILFFKPEICALSEAVRAGILKYFCFLYKASVK